MEGIRLEWLDGPDGQGPNPATPEEWAAIDDVLIGRGWMSLNRTLSRVLVARRGEKIVGFHVMQLVPHAEPLWIEEAERGGTLAAEMADQMVKFLTEVQCRGWMVTADSPFAEKLCEDHGMKKVESPVYVAR